MDYLLWEKDCLNQKAFSAFSSTVLYHSKCYSNYLNTAGVGNRTHRTQMNYNSFSLGKKVENLQDNKTISQQMLGCMPREIDAFKVSFIQASHLPTCST